MTRVVVNEVETKDTWIFGYAITDDGRLPPPSRRTTSALDNNGSIYWTAIWDDLPDTSVVIKVAVFREFQPQHVGRGFWQPIHLPSEQTPAQVISVERILNTHGLSLAMVVGLKQGGRRVV